MKKIILLAALVLTAFSPYILYGREYHVMKTGNDSGNGSLSSPFKTISKASAVALQGDVITVHQGIYRERISPSRGGSLEKPVVYQAMPGDTVVISGAERVTGWVKENGNTWRLSLPNSFLGETNPFDELIYGSWYRGKGKPNHTGEVYLNNERLRERFSLSEVLTQSKEELCWYAEADGNGGDILLNMEWIEPVGGKRMNSMRASVKGGDQAVCISVADRWPFGYLKDGSELYFDGLDFGQGTDSLLIQAATLAKAGLIEMHLDTPTGELIGRTVITNTGDWEKFGVFALKMSRRLQGRHDICLCLKSPATRVDGRTTIWAHFPEGTDPNRENVEITVRPQVFYPATPYVDYITIRGFILEKAATNWAPPSAEQPALIGTRWSKGWVIENNVIRNSRCSGISLGRPTFGHAHHYQQMPPKIYVEANSGCTVEELADYFKNASWDKDKTGHHIIRGNQIYNCGQAGIVGCSGGAFSLIENNEIHDICVNESFEGDEMAGIKLHFATDAVIRNNHIYRTIRGLWLDWGAQGIQVTGNLFHDNTVNEDIFIEVCPGPVLVADNILLSPHALNLSQGIAGVHNLITGKVTGGRDRCAGGRLSYYYPPHETVSLGKASNPGGDYQWMNNLFTARQSFGIWDEPEYPIISKNNSFALSDVCLTEKADGWYLSMNVPQDSLRAIDCRLIKTSSLNKTVISKQAFTNPDGSNISLDTDYLGEKRKSSRVSPGPFNLSPDKRMVWKVWPKNHVR